MDKRVLAALCIIGLLPLGAAGEDLVTVSGQTYSNIVVRRYDRKGIVIRHDGGETRLLYREILPELRGYYKKMALDTTPDVKRPGEKEDPAGTNDLATLSGPIYRNVVVKRIEEHAIQIAHDGGWAKVYFSEIPKAERERYRTAAIVPDTPPGTNDLVATDGQVFRNVEFLKAEPDGLTFRHAGGVTKLRFPSLPPELREKHGYDPEAARTYQRAQAAEKKRAQQEAERRKQEAAAKAAKPVPGDPISLMKVKADEIQGGYRIRFAVRNHTGQAQSIRVVPYDSRSRAIMGGKKYSIPPRAEEEPVEIVVPISRPKQLTVYCGDFRTNRTLRW